LLPALEQLTVAQRVTVVLVHGYGWSQADAAELLDVSPSTVRTHLHRALTQLRLTLGIHSDAETTLTLDPDPADGTVEHSPKCRHVDETGACDEIVGSRTIRYLTGTGGHVSIRTEHGPAESSFWMHSRINGEPVALGEYSGFVAPGPTPSVLFETDRGVEVIVFGEGNVDRATLILIAESLVPVAETLVLPVVFGETVPSPAEAPDNDLNGVPYYAAYLDVVDGAPCIGGIGIPVNWGETCFPLSDQPISVVIATPSVAGTIVVAAVPESTVRVEAVAEGVPPRVIPIVELPGPGFRLVFADLDDLVPERLVAYDAVGPLATADVVSTGGAPLGYQ
jgi:Sigma-70, region 4